MFALSCSPRPGSRGASLRPTCPRLSLLGFSALALLGCPLLNAPAYAQTTINQTFTYTGGLQTFVVPDGVSSVFVRLWGAAGGGLNGGPSPGTGAGAFVSGSLSVTPGSTLTLLVGGGGGGYPAGAGGFGGGGNGHLGGGGGGRSGILLGATELVDAGGGGGMGVFGFGGTLSGGAGGVVSGYAGSDAQNGSVAGKGGTQTAGGSAGGGGSTSGSQFQGGSGGGGGGINGGGGGGGYFGGGGGDTGTIPGAFPFGYTYAGGGGGGSSYTSSSLFTLTLGQDGSGGILPGTPGGTSDPFYLAGVGSGISIGTFTTLTGGNGEIVLSYTTVPEPGSVALLVGLGVTGAGFLRRRRKQARKASQGRCNSAPV